MNYSRVLLDHGGPWYDQLHRHGYQPSQRGAGHRQGKATSLHTLQYVFQEATCFLKAWEPRTRHCAVEVKSKPGAKLDFSIAGGVEIPHVCLSLWLVYNDDQTNTKTMQLELKFAAWGENTNNMPKPAPDVILLELEILLYLSKLRSVHTNIMRKL